MAELRGTSSRPVHGGYPGEVIDVARYLHCPNPDCGLHMPLDTWFGEWCEGCGSRFEVRRITPAPEPTIVMFR